jgi:hypothetical protein
MILPDLNVVIYTFRPDVPQRAICRTWIGAVAHRMGREWSTLDRDFARFPGLRWRAPATSTE